MPGPASPSAGERDAPPGIADVMAVYHGTEIAPLGTLARAEAAESQLASIAAGLDEFAPSNTGLSLPESVALLRTRLSEVRAEIEGKGGWRERLAEITRALEALLAATDAEWFKIAMTGQAPAVEQCHAILRVRIAARALLSSGAGDGRE